MFIHTIEIASEVRASGTVTATRKSERRIYSACVVATVTESSRAVALAMKATAEATALELVAKIAEALAATGLTEAQASEVRSASYSYNGRNCPPAVKAWSRLQSAHHDAKSHAKVRVFDVGTQAVISWHGNAGLAAKATKPSDHLTRQGFVLGVRTDVVVRDTKAAKEVA